MWGSGVAGWKDKSSNASTAQTRLESLQNCWKKSPIAISCMQDDLLVKLMLRFANIECRIEVWMNTLVFKKEGQFKIRSLL